MTGFFVLIGYTNNSYMDKEQVYKDYHDKVLRYILGQVNDFYLAEDICSDVFLKVYEKLDSFDKTKASISTWIFTITRNKLIDYYRTRKVTVEVPDTLVYEEPIEEFDKETLEILANALEKLDDRSKKLIIGRYYQKKTLKEIAEELGISYPYAKILHQKALLILRSCFK